MGRSTSNNSDENHEPADLQIEQRELIECRNQSVSKQHDASSDDVKALIDNEGLPSLHFEIGNIEGDQSHEGLSVDQVGRSSSEDP